VACDHQKKGRTPGAAFRYFEAIFKGAPGVLKNHSSSGA
jgi:hypothetical protein